LAVLNYSVAENHRMGESVALDRDEMSSGREKGAPMQCINASHIDIAPNVLWRAYVNQNQARMSPDFEIRERM
jgi:hypothetical protein